MKLKCGGKKKENKNLRENKQRHNVHTMDNRKLGEALFAPSVAFHHLG